MIYVNGIALIEAMDEMGVVEQQNFYSNPINITLKPSTLNPLAGSVQCLSRPMEEAEIYGVGLERGQAMNLYILPHLNQLSLIETTTTSIITTIKKTTQQQNNFKEFNIDTTAVKNEVNFF